MWSRFNEGWLFASHLHDRVFDLIIHQKVQTVIIRKMLKQFL